MHWRPASMTTCLREENDMLPTTTWAAKTPPLQGHPWPPVHPYTHLDPDLEAFLALTGPQQRQVLADWRCTPERHGRVLHTWLATCFGYRYGYADSPCFQHTDERLEVQLTQAELVLGQELLT